MPCRRYRGWGEPCPVLEVQRVEENFIWFKSQRFLQRRKEAFHRLPRDAIDKIHIDAGKAKGFQQR
jgi:hypothetical protein